jgi:hypothetical protein
VIQSATVESTQSGTGVFESGFGWTPPEVVDARQETRGREGRWGRLTAGIKEPKHQHRSMIFWRFVDLMK